MRLLLAEAATAGEACDARVRDQQTLCATQLAAAAADCSARLAPLTAEISQLQAREDDLVEVVQATERELGLWKAWSYIGGLGDAVDNRLSRHRQIRGDQMETRSLDQRCSCPRRSSVSSGRSRQGSKPTMPLASRQSSKSIVSLEARAKSVDHTLDGIRAELTQLREAMVRVETLLRGRATPPPR